MTNNQNKAPQTLAARGYADNALEAALSEVLDFRDQYARACARGVIITKNFKKLEIIIVKNLLKPVFYSNNLLGFGVGAGYSCGSLKSRLHPAAISQFFYVPILAACLLTCGLSSMGAVLVNGNVPALLERESSAPTLFGEALNSQNLGGSHA